ncbi:head-tail connector protein [Sphingomonas sp. TX0543]|uniref:head-tail connector protein n=1 Tax=unclassified Sphingomonas TaxID=196159 RepID=UPI0010F7484B|nr:hypothetical protein [Sphingomonas sp. 3P27F8]
MSAAPVPAAAAQAAVAAAREFLRDSGVGEQALLEQLAASAILLGEAFTGTLLIRRAVDEVLPVSADWRMLAEAPVNAIAQITGLPEEGAPFALPTAGHAIDIDGDGRGWIRVSAPGNARRIAVNYTAGVATDWAALPAPIAQGVVALIAHLFEDRGRATQPPAAVAALWRPYRRLRLTTERRA